MLCILIDNMLYCNEVFWLLAFGWFEFHFD